ncbi:ABC-2 family transporter protein [Lactobacillus sp. R2/2]|nr:ABC-2 family transporter protein [Lactobacillus sp. R2/2]
MSFRLDTVFGIISSVLWLGIPIAFFKVIYLNVDTVGGWSFKECFLLVGVYTMLDGFLMAFLVKSMPKMEADIREGTLDSVLLKPINTKLFYFFSSIEFTQLINSVLGLSSNYLCVSRISKLVISPTSLFLYFPVYVGCILYYSLWYLWTISAFWFPTNFGRNDLF